MEAPNDTETTDDKPSKPLSTDTMRITVTADMIKELSAQKPKPAPVAVQPQAIAGSHAGLQSPVSHVQTPAAANPAIVQPQPVGQTQPQLVVHKKKYDLSFIVAIIGAIIITAGICIFALNSEKYDAGSTNEGVSEESTSK